ncbi:rho GTPase-activating protein 33 isoform X1 [Pangasianodon hypophthalmus]|uniref:rho GTPase-activating protein 33 isoform X1 n=3 Tax=Pangasianodon hypophthalmus TaxID=310915 RepID=UPI00147FC5DB|nr:rho GTPase-activating protein 33 isoform X1 [Pangasianodon hypophthalmus]
MQRRGTVSGPHWVRKCVVFMRAMSLTEMPGFSLPSPMRLALPARSTDNLDSSGEPATRSIGSTANLKGRMSKRVSVVKGHFPKLTDCAHFHYDNVDFGSIELQFASEQSDASWSSANAKDLVFLVQVSCQGKTWTVRRTYEEFRTLDAHLHQCIYDRRYSQLLTLPSLSEIGDRVELFTPMLSEYLSRLSVIVDSKLNCGPVLTWMEIDNHGNRFLLKEEASLNVPAIAAAHVIKRYTAQASDEISIEVGDILSVIDMPPKEETTWWRGKHGFQVGFFPSECVELINEKMPQSVSTPAAKIVECDAGSSRPGVASAPGSSSPTSVSKKHGKLMGFLRAFMKSRPSKQKLKQRGILKERVFGCDLGEHLLNSGQDVPQVLKSCSEFIEKHGIVDGIYRHSGISSNIQKLRHEFDSENVPDLTKDVYMQDIHCVGSLCKLYFRELPNPLLTYQLYDKFADCMGEMTEDERMVKVHDVIQQLPPPHYRTLEYLIKHLARLATFSEETNMHIKNLAIVWAPNLLRSKEIEAAGLNGADPFKEVRIQSVVVEFLLTNVEVLFSDSFTSVGRFTAARQSLTRPKSFVSTRLLSLEEAQARSQAPLLLQGSSHPLQDRFHTVLDLPTHRRKRGPKVRKAAGGSWKTFFAIGKPAGSGRRKPIRITSLFQPSTSHAGCRVDSVTLRSAKSEESLSSQHSGAGQGKLQRLRRPRSSSDGLSLAASMDPQLLAQPLPSQIPPSRSYDSLLPDETRDTNDDEDDEDDEEGVYMLPDFSQEPATSWMAEDVADFSPTFPDEGPIGIGSSGPIAPGDRESPSAATPPPYRCLSRQGHARSGSQRSITEDPDSVLNQSEAAARRSLILAAAAPTQQVFCQHRPPAVNTPASSTTQPGDPNLSPSQSQPTAPPAPVPSAQPPQERRSFTKKVVHALSPKAPKSPPLDISDPIAISVPAKVLEMIGGRAGELQSGNPGGGPSQPPQMISMLLKSCDFQLTESCQQELSSKFGQEVKTRGPSVIGPTGAPLPSQKPPPPPPKNPARLMALALTESANKALRQGASPPYRPRQAGSPPEADVRFQRSLSADTGAMLSSDPDQLYSTVRPLSVWMSEGGGEVNTSEKTTDLAQEEEPRSPPGQDTGTLSSDGSVSDSGTSNSELSAGSSSGDNEKTPSPIYNQKPQLPAPPNQTPKSSPPAASEVPSQRKPPAYGRQFSAPHLQQQMSGTESKSPNQAHSQLLHSRSESSPLVHIHAFQPTRPKVPPRPLDSAPPRPPISKTDRHDFMRRSLDAGRIRRMVGPAPGNPPLSRAFSERISSTSDALSRYHAARLANQAAQVTTAQPLMQQQQAQTSHIRPAFSSSEDPSNMENLYYEISAPDHPPSYSQHSYQNMRLDVDGNYRLSEPANQRPQSRGHHPPPYSQVPGSARAPQLWSSEATRAWTAAHSHSSSFSHSHSHRHSHNNPPGPRGHPRLQRQTSSSVRLTRSELHPIPAATGLGSSGGLVPLSVHQRSLHCSMRSPSSNLTASQLHPYFENGKVCYRYFETSGHMEGPLSHLQPSMSKSHQAYSSQTSPIQAYNPPSKDEPIYVNYPFTSPPGAGMNAKTWTTTDLDGDVHQGAEPVTHPPEQSTEDEQQSPDKALDQECPTTSFESPTQNDGASDSKALEMPTASDTMHFRSHSDPQSSSIEPSQALTGKDIASLLIEKLAEDEREGLSVATSSSASSSPHVEYPPNPYPSQHHKRPPPAYNPGSSRGHFESQGLPREGSGAFQRQDPMRRSSSGQYRQAFDVMPSGDQVLKFYRSQDFIPTPQGESTTPNPYPTRPHCQDSTSHIFQAHPDTSHSSASPLVAFSNLALSTPRGYGAQMEVNPYNQYPYQAGPVLPPYPNAPRRDVILDPALRPPGLRSQRDLNRQGNLSGPNWSIHTEGQTRSYC